MTAAKHTGGCLCGAIRYEISESPMIKINCHCRMCQQWTGSSMLAAATFDSQAVSYTKGTPKLYQSSSVSERGFCSDCGSSMFTRYFSGGVFDNVIHILIGTLDEPDIGEPDCHYGTESEISWMHRDDGIPRVRIDGEVTEQNALFEKMLAGVADKTK